MKTLRTAIGMLLLMTSTLLAADAKLRIEPREKWSAVFGDSEVTFSFDLSSTESFDGQVGWLLAAKKRTILRGEVPVAVVSDKPATVTIPLRIPPVKEGLVFEAELTVSIHEGGSRKAAVSLVKPLWIYARDPFVDRSQWLKDLQLTLYDPGGKTAAVLDKAHVPFRELRNTAALAAMPEGLLVIGEDVSLDDHRDLAEAACQAAARGVPVLCLAAADGSFDLPDGGAVPPSTADADQNERMLPRGSGRPQSLTFRRADVLADLDHRLDAQGWPPDGQLVARGLALTSERGRVVAQVTDSVDGWAWLQLRYPPPGATLVVCQCTIIQRWDAGPTPRFLLARLLEYLDEGRRMKDEG